jgi:hypothetical protein
MSFQLSAKRVLTALALASLTVGGTYTVAQAQGSGFVLFGKDDVDVLNYYLDFGGQRNSRDRYRLRIPGNKLRAGVAKIVISYPEYFDGEFDTDRIEVRTKKGEEESLPIREVIWDEKSRIVQIDLEEPVKENRKLEIVMHNVKNPDVGTYYFFCQILPATDLPVREQIGAWVVSINP